jgi:hypothetical protein
LWGILAVEGISKGGKYMSSYVLGFQDIDRTKLMAVGGKGANLGELCFSGSDTAFRYSAEK